MSESLEETDREIFLLKIAAASYVRNPEISTHQFLVDEDDFTCECGLKECTSDHCRTTCLLCEHYIGPA